MIALGYFVGPPVGGFLYAYGFHLPFVVLSALVLLFILPILWLYPAKRAAVDSSTPAMTVAPRSSECSEGDDATECDAATPTGLKKAEEKTVAAVPLASWCQLASLLPFDVWVIAATAALYSSKWAWWDIHFTAWLVTEFGETIQR